MPYQPISSDEAERVAAALLVREICEEHAAHRVSADGHPGVAFTAVLHDHRPHRFVLTVQEVTGEHLE